MEQRTALSDLLQQLLKQRDQREQELRQVLVRKLFLSVSNSTPVPAALSARGSRADSLHRRLCEVIDVERGGQFRCGSDAPPEEVSEASRRLCEWKKPEVQSRGPSI